MKILRNPRHLTEKTAFSLVEMAVVIAILVIVMIAGIGLQRGSLTASRRTAVDLVSAMADKARTMAITNRTPVVMAFAAPGDLAAGEDGRYRIGLFQVTSEAGEESAVVRTVTALGNWKPLAHGILWGTGKLDGAVNPWDFPRLALRTDRGLLHIHGIIFTAGGGISSPSGPSPAVIRIAEFGGHAATGRVPETRLRVGRVTGRIYQSDQ